MSEEPRMRIREKTYAYPDPIGKVMFLEPGLIEVVTGLTHLEYRERYVAWAKSILDREDKEDESEQEIAIDPVLWSGLVATALSRENSSWSRGQIVEFMHGLEFDEVTIEGGDAGPPAEAATSAESNSSNGDEPAKTSSSESEPDSKKSTTPQISGLSTLPT